MKLINKIKITALFLMTVSLSSAQNNIEGGLKVSFNMPSSCEKGVDGVSGVSFGYFETLYLTERLALQGEINFSEFGFEKKIGEGDTEEEKMYFNDKRSYIVVYIRKRDID